MAFNVSEARKLVLDLGQPKSGIYFLDLLLSYAVGVAGFVLAYVNPPASLTFWAGATLSMMGLYRALSFIHELVHFRGRLPRFKIVWDILCGIPLAFPSFMYVKSHTAHHNPKTYGTKYDGEYIDFYHQSRWHMVAYLVESFWTPVLLILRFAILFPLSLLIPTLRKFLVEHGSSVVIAKDYVGEWPSEREKREWLTMETACCLFWLALIGWGIAGVIPLKFFGTLYVVMVGALFFNTMRTLAAHRFANDGRILSMEEQLLDSVNLDNRFPASVLSALAAPVGLRFHALHHLFPFLPYHNLGEAHRRLSKGLAPDNIYHRANASGVLSAFGKLWRRDPKIALRPIETAST